MLQYGVSQVGNCCSEYTLLVAAILINKRQDLGEMTSFILIVFSPERREILFFDGLCAVKCV